MHSRYRRIGTEVRCGDRAGACKSRERKFDSLRAQHFNWIERRGAARGGVASQKR
jgi:hypothetical protein